VARPPAPRTAHVGIGSNQDDPVRQVRDALDELAALPSTRLAACSSLYRSAPVGGPDQPDFVNAVARLETALAPVALLQRLLAIEQRHARVRGERNGPRTLDLDLLLVDHASPATDGRSEAGPICFVTQGMIRESLFWATGKGYDVEETSCKAKGPQDCEFKIIAGK